MQLRRADIGFGTVTIDETGVRRKGLFRTRHLAWGDIEDYRLTIELGPNDGIEYTVDVLRDAMWVRDCKRALDGRSPVRLGIELIGPRRVAFNWRFRDAELGIARILGRIARPLAQRARSAGSHVFGPLDVGAHALGWLGRKPLARADVEAIELFDCSPVVLRVMKRGAVFPYASARLAAIPNLAAVLDRARRLGYPVVGSLGRLIEA